MYSFNELFTWSGRAIGLLDLDAFFASVEQLDHPEWRGKPVIVGGSSQSRGVVATASYEARAYGVRSALPSYKAEQLCPEAIWVSGRFSRYREVSNQVMDIIRDETPWIEQVSIDEAFFDISPSRTQAENPITICRRIQARVEELGITCSIGLACTKALAKIASEQEKPRGLTCIYPGSEPSILARTPCSALSGIGKVANNALSRLNINTLQELGEAPIEVLIPIFGKRARLIQLRAQAQDTEEIELVRERKSVSQEMSFVTNLTSEKELVVALKSLSSAVARRLRLLDLEGAQVSVKIKYGYDSGTQAQVQLTHPTCKEETILKAALDLTLQHWDTSRSIRLLGVGVSRFDKASQLYLDMGEEDYCANPIPGDEKINRDSTLYNNQGIEGKDGSEAESKYPNTQLDQAHVRKATAAKQTSDSRPELTQYAPQADLISGNLQNSLKKAPQDFKAVPASMVDDEDKLERLNRLQEVSDAIKNKFGEKYLVHGYDLVLNQGLSSGGRKDPKDFT